MIKFAFLIVLIASAWGFLVRAEPLGSASELEGVSAVQPVDLSAPISLYLSSEHWPSFLEGFSLSPSGLGGLGYSIFSLDPNSPPLATAGIPGALLSLDLEVSEVPEPSAEAYLLWIFGALVIITYRRRAWL